MNEAVQILVYTGCAGACIPLGALLAKVERIRPRWLESEFRHAVIAFGGGILVAAVALVLVPEGTVYVNHAVLSVVFLLAGGLGFFLVEHFLGVRRRERPQLTAMLLDYVPESLALGGAFAVGAKSAPLLALFIGLQNIPEGFNAYRELCAGKPAGGRAVLGVMALLVPVGPAIALVGYCCLSDHVRLLGAVMLFASGGILYLIFQDIAPQSRMRRHWAPPLGAVLGFAVGVLGSSLTAGD